MGDPTVAVGYIRVSTDRQDESPGAQLAELEGWSAKHGVRLAAVFEDIDVGGADRMEDRPGFLRALNALRQHAAGTLLVRNRQRFVRDAELSYVLRKAIKQHGAVLQTLDGLVDDDSPNTNLIGGILDNVHEFERRMISDNTSRILQNMQKQGRPAGGKPPHGQRIVWGDDYVDAQGVRRRRALRLEPDPDELRAIARVVELRKLGLSFAAVALRLQEEGFRPRGKKWHRTTVFNLAQLSRDSSLNADDALSMPEVPVLVDAKLPTGDGKAVGRRQLTTRSNPKESGK